MRKVTQHTCILGAIFLVISCAAPRQAGLPTEFSANIRSGDINLHLMGNTLPEVMEFRTYKDSLIGTINSEKAVTYGLIIPRSAYATYAGEYKMIFGTDSLNCTTNYAFAVTSYEQESSSLLLSIISSKDNSATGSDGKKITWLHKLIAGTMELPHGEPGSFRYEWIKAEKILQPDTLTGYLKTATDSLVLEPVYREYRVRKSDPPYQYDLVGLRLSKGETLCAYLKHNPKNIFGRDKLSLYTLTTPAEQLLMASYMVMVSRLL